MKKLFTSESVLEGHPDKLCDLISDKILDCYLSQDKNSRVACETVVGKDTVFITGEITSSANVDVEKIARETIKSIGYFGENIDIDYKTCKIITNISKQSTDIALGVEKGAGDQGMMFGFACNETEELMPLPIFLAHKLAIKLSTIRKNNELQYLGPDGKVQITVEYDNDAPKRVDTIVVSVQHKSDIDLDILKKDIIEKAISQVIPSKYIDENTNFFINPSR